MAHPYLFRVRLGAGVERALSQKPGARPNRAVDRFRSADPDRLRLRSRSRPRRGRQGRCSGLPSRGHADPAGRHSPRSHEHVDDHQCAGGVDAVAVHRRGRPPGGGAVVAVGNHPERHHQGIPLPRHLHLSARPLHAADVRRDRVHLPGSTEVEPDQCLFLSPPGGRCDAGAGTRVRPGHVVGGARHRQGLRPGPRRGFPQGRRADQLLLQRRNPVFDRAVQAAGLHRSLGRDHRGALWGGGPEIPALPLRCPGQFPRPHRAAAGEQRLSHSAGDAGGGAVEGRPRPRRAVAGVERGPGPTPTVGPAMVAEAAADRRLRDRPARVRRHLRRLAGDRGEGRATEVPGARGTRPHRRDGRRRYGRRVELHEAAAGGVQRQAAGRHRIRGAGRHRRQQVRRGRTVAADRHRGERHDRRSAGGGRADRRPPGVARKS